MLGDVRLITEKYAWENFMDLSSDVHLSTLLRRPECFERAPVTLHMTLGCRVRQASL